MGYKVKRPIHITLNKCFLKIMGCSLGESANMNTQSTEKYMSFYKGRP